MTDLSISRNAGIGLVVYGIGTTIAFGGSGSPGGDYATSMVTSYVAPGHYIAAWALWYLGALCGVGGLVAVAVGVRRLPLIGPAVSTLATIGAAVSLVGAFVSGGLDVAMAEGGTAVRDGVAAPVVYTFTEIGNLLAVCAPALCLGLAALLLAARAPLPSWLRVFSVIAGICGILAPLFFTLFVYVLWTIAAGVVLTRKSATTQPLDEPQPSIV
jgi:hypothetical protein